jgi:uncharacterized membrane protein
MRCKGERGHREGPKEERVEKGSNMVYLAVGNTILLLLLLLIIIIVLIHGVIVLVVVIIIFLIFLFFIVIVIVILVIVLVVLIHAISLPARTAREFALAFTWRIGLRRALRAPLRTRTRFASVKWRV